MSGIIRLATLSDVPVVAAVFARAFFDDPVTSWTFPNPATRARRLAGLYSAIIRYEGVPMGSTFVAEDSSRLLGAAVWRRRARRDRLAWRDVPFSLASGWALGRELGRTMSAGRSASRARPRTSHWYLQLLGVDPDLQRTGIGSALVREQLATCDAERMPAYLETTAENVDFYVRLGFEVTGGFAVGNDALRQYSMWRYPR